MSLYVPEQKLGKIERFCDRLTRFLNQSGYIALVVTCEAVYLIFIRNQFVTILDRHLGSCGNPLVSRRECSLKVRGGLSV